MSTRGRGAWLGAGLERGSWLAVALCAPLLGCPSEPAAPRDDEPTATPDDDDASTPDSLGEPGCVLAVTNGTKTTLSSLSSGVTPLQFEPEELLAAPLLAGERRELTVAPRGHHLVALDEAAGWYAVGWVLCVWDEALAVTVSPGDLLPPGIRLENGTSADITSLRLSPVREVAWGEELLLDSPIPDFGFRNFALPLGRWYVLARNELGTGYFANFEVLTTPPQFELAISRMFVVPGQPCTWTVTNAHDAALVRIGFTEAEGPGFVSFTLPVGEPLQPGEMAQGFLPPGIWNLELRFSSAQFATFEGLLCIDAEQLAIEGAP